MTKTYNLSVATGKYMKDGVEKTKWKNIGGIFESNGSRFILLDRTFNPAGVPDLDKEGKYRASETVLINIFNNDDGENNS